MAGYTGQNKKAWEYNAYDFWCQSCAPLERAKADVTVFDITEDNKTVCYGSRGSCGCNDRFPGLPGELTLIAERA